jgi:peptidoglycan/xylan/chitin deacetylase (PgdA/CDA1 family)
MMIVGREVPYTIDVRRTSIRMLRNARIAVLKLLRASGAFKFVADSAWRQKRLLILCYHGTSVQDEHLWRPYRYIHPAKLEQRLETLKKGRFSVLPLAEGLERLRAGTLPARSIVLTFDDGTYDFYGKAYPLLRQYGFPATVYQTTYYTPLQVPVFNLVCNYMLWKRRDEVIPDGSSVGLPGELDTRTEASRFQIVRRLIENSARNNNSGLEKDEIAARLAALLRIDYADLKAKRILHLMNGRELQEIASNGIDVQLHTHRHRTPEDEKFFCREIVDNRVILEKLGLPRPAHFCYPSGVYRESFLPWLRKEDVISATTCDTGLADSASERLLLPRYIDHQRRAQIEFESWISGIGNLLVLRRKALQNAPPNYAQDPSAPS